MKTRCDLEQEIFHCWNVTKDIDMLYEAIIEYDLTKDQITNILIGMKELYELKFTKMFDTFEHLIEVKKI